VLNIWSLMDINVKFIFFFFQFYLMFHCLCIQSQSYLSVVASVALLSLGLFENDCSFQKRACRHLISLP
jgi:hypothetical protein